MESAGTASQVLPSAIAEDDQEVLLKKSRNSTMLTQRGEADTVSKTFDRHMAKA
jgi:hypothetical protein